MQVGKMSVNNIAETVKNNMGEDIKLIVTPTNDNRSYHISSEKIRKVLDFETNFTISDAVKDLVEAFDKKLLTNTLSDNIYFNIKRMQKVNLK